MGESFAGRSLRAAVVVGLVAAGLIGAAVARASTKLCSPTWDAQPANVGSGPNQLNGVSAVSKCDVWAVGYRSDVHARTNRTLVEHWNGRRWKVFASPNPGGSNGTELSGVAATSSDNAWAVGDYSNGTWEQTLIEHWNGKAWKVQPSPDPGGSTNNATLSAVAAVSSTDAWAVGNYYNGSAYQTLILHWNGHKWKQQPSAIASTFGRRKGKAMARAAVGLTGVAATSSTNAWAVGFHYNGTSNRTLIEHWNGKAWRVQTSRNPGGPTNDHTLTAVAATASGHAWAVGNYFDGSTTQPLIERWNGRAWKVQASPNPGGASGTVLNGVAATSSTNAWAVGDYGNFSDPPVVEWWNGKIWRVRPSLNIGRGSLFAVTATSPADAWAVGDYDNGITTQTFALHCC